MGENYSCSGKHEQMSVVVASAYRRTLPQTSSVNRRECSHSIQFNPNSKDKGDCTPALDRSYMPELRQSQYCWAISEITESSQTGWPWADLILSFTADPANVAGIMHCLSLSPAPISHRLAQLCGRVKVKKYLITSQWLFKVSKQLKSWTWIANVLLHSNTYPITVYRKGKTHILSQGW